MLSLDYNDPIDNTRTEEGGGEWANTKKLCLRRAKSELINDRRQEECKAGECRPFHEKNEK
jgi:hypothetical protein